MSDDDDVDYGGPGKKPVGAMSLSDYLRATRSESTKRGMEVFGKGGRPKKEEGSIT